MSIRSQITTAVNSAFRSVGDLTETVILTVTTSNSYNFATSTASSVTSSTSVSAIVLEIKEGANEENVGSIRKEVYIKQSDLSDPSIFDKITISGVVHSIISYSSFPGLVILNVTEG